MIKPVPTTNSVFSSVVNGWLIEWSKDRKELESLKELIISVYMFGDLSMLKPFYDKYINE